MVDSPSCEGLGALGNGGGHSIDADNDIDPSISAAGGPNEPKQEISSSRSRSQIAKGKHIWTIENYRLRSHQTSILSEVFVIRGYKFQLKIYPRQTEHVANQEENGEEHLAVFLWCMGPSYPQEGVEVHFEIKNQVDASNSISEFKFPRPHVFTRNNPSKGYWQICTSQYILSQGRGFIGEDGTLVVSVAIEFLYYCDDISPKVTFPKPKSTLTHDLDDLLANASHSDVEIRGRNPSGVRFSRKVHKMILSARSPVFRAMFGQEMKENLDNVVYIDDVDEEVMDAMLDYMYSDREPSESLAGRLLIVADRYQMNSLDLMCQSVLARALSVKNAVDIAMLTDVYQHCSQLKKYVIEYIIQNFDEILQRDSWTKMMSVCPHLVTRIMLQSRSSSYAADFNSHKRRRFDREN